MSTILVTEDEVGLRVAIGGQLAPFGDVIVARTKEEALSLITRRAKAKASINLAVVDLRLIADDHIDQDGGFAIVDQLAVQFRDTPVIILTVRNDLQAWERACKSPSVFYFIAKPHASSDLCEAARFCLENKAPRSTREPYCLGGVEGKRGRRL